MMLRTSDDVTAIREMHDVLTSMCETLNSGYHDVSVQVVSATVIADLTHWPQSLQDDIGESSSCQSVLHLRVKKVIAPIHQVETNCL